MRFTLSFFLFILLLGSIAFDYKSQPKGHRVVNEMIKDLPFGIWFHSHEEDQNQNSDWKTYRKSGYNFPPSRGRNGFMLYKDHKFGLIKPSANDGRDTLWGTWEITTLKGYLRLSIPETQLSTFVCEGKGTNVQKIKIW